MQAVPAQRNVADNRAQEAGPAAPNFKADGPTPAARPKHETIMHETHPPRRRAAPLLLAVLLLAGAGGPAARGEKKKTIMNNETPSGAEHRAAPQEQVLTAGPVRLKFADGELRYLHIGDKEIVRRVYFAVRDKNWGTAMPRFTTMRVQRQKNGFTIDLEAVCKTELADYTWRGKIVGAPDGQITFQAGGAANRDFGSQRIGICVLYGAESLAGQAFETVLDGGAPTPGAFPALVSPALVASDFRTLRYKTAGGLTVSGTIAGTQFDMEDQRNYGDSSFKAYAPLAYAYPDIKAGDAREETFTLRVENAPALRPPAHSTYVRLGGVVPNVKVPRLAPAGADARDSLFVGINNNRDKHKDAETLTFSFNPAVHLPDDDTLMENPPAILDQVRTARSFAPRAAIRVEPVHLGRANDPRAAGRFGAAWSLAALKYLTLAGVAEVGYRFAPGPARALWEEAGAYTGRPVRAVSVVYAGRAPVEAFAVDDDGAPVLWIANTTSAPQSVVCENLPPAARYTLRRANENTQAGGAALQPSGQNAISRQGGVSVSLQPYEVCEVRAAR